MSEPRGLMLLAWPLADEEQRNVAEALAAGPTQRLHRAIRWALRNTVASHLLSSLERIGAPMADLSIPRADWDGCKSATSLQIDPSIRPEISLKELSAAYRRHSGHLDRVLTPIVESAGHKVCVLFGKGIALAHPEQYDSRFSHDLDLLCASEEVAWNVTGQLSRAEFNLTTFRRYDTPAGSFCDWKLDGRVPDGHRLHVDLTVGGMANADSWMPAFALPILESALGLAMEGGTTLVPSDTHQVVLLFEKAQRNVSLSAREVNDLRLLIGYGAVDWAVVGAEVDRLNVGATASWILRRLEQLRVVEIPSGARALLRPRRRTVLQAVIHRDSRMPAATQEVARAVQRLLGRSN